MNWFLQPAMNVVGLSVLLVVVTSLVAWARRCRHPNPHYVRAGPEPAHYVCYECGRAWPVEQRDPAWKPTGIMQKFRGHDERQAVRAARHAAIADAQRRLLASHRAMGPWSGPGSASRRARHRRRGRTDNVYDIDFRKPA